MPELAKNVPTVNSDPQPITQSITLIPIHLLSHIETDVIKTMCDNNCVMITDKNSNIIKELSHNSVLGTINIT